MVYCSDLLCFIFFFASKELECYLIKILLNLIHVILCCSVFRLLNVLKYLSIFPFGQYHIYGGGGEGGGVNLKYNWLNSERVFMLNMFHTSRKDKHNCREKAKGPEVFSFAPLIL